MLDVDRKTLSISLKYTHPEKDKSVAKKRKYRKLKEEDKFRSVFVFEDPNI